MALASGPLAFVQRGNSVFGRASALRHLLSCLNHSPETRSGPAASCVEQSDFAWQGSRP